VPAVSAYNMFNCFEVLFHFERAPLHHGAVVVALLAGGAAVNTADITGATPLHFAARYGRETVVAALLGAGANVDQSNNRGDTPLRTAKAGRCRLNP